MQNKITLRRSLIADRQAIAADLRVQWNAAICARIVAWWNAHRTVRTLGVYSPIRGEPDVQGAYAVLAAHGVQLALPVVAGKDAPLKFAAWTPGDALARDAFGVLIPVSTEAIVQPDALLIPCVGFNDARMRLGYGGGFYDRTLAVLPRPFTMGVAYACAQAVFDAEVHDIALDMIVTDAGFIPTL